MDQILELQRMWNVQLAEARLLLAGLIRLGPENSQNNRYGDLIQSGIKLICLSDCWTDVSFRAFKIEAVKFLASNDFAGLKPKSGKSH